MVIIASYICDPIATILLKTPIYVNTNKNTKHIFVNEWSFGNLHFYTQFKTFSSKFNIMLSKFWIFNKVQSRRWATFGIWYWTPLHLFSEYILPHGPPPIPFSIFFLTAIAVGPPFRTCKKLVPLFRLGKVSLVLLFTWYFIHKLSNLRKVTKSRIKKPVLW